MQSKRERLGKDKRHSEAKRRGKGKGAAKAKPLPRPMYFYFPYLSLFERHRVKASL